MSERELLGELQRSGKCKAVLLDVDDTIIRFSEGLWRPALGYAAENIAPLVKKDKTEILRTLKTLNNQIYRESAMGVHPSKYGRMADIMAEKYHAEPAAIKQIMKAAMIIIYLSDPPLIPEAKEAMKLLDDCGIEVGLVSHSARGRIVRMAKSWKLENEPLIFTESMMVRKGYKVWNRALMGMGVNGKQAIAVGDNLEGDILASREAGVEYGVWIKPIWNEYAKGQLPEGVLQVENIGQLAGAIISIFA
jgi:FMN phosphatase YigB (HAD superfamily)